MKKVVLAGGSCSGKTTIIEELEKRDFDVVGEFAREVLEERKGFKENPKETLIRQRLMLDRQLEEENKFEINPPLLNLLFLDRCLIDILVYCKRGMGFIPDDFLETIKKNRYHKIFFLEQLPFKADGLRIESDEKEAKELHEEVLDFYQRMGYKPVSVPVMSVDERVNFILKNLD